MTEQQKATTADAESLLQRASDLCIEIVKRGPYATGNAANLRNDIDRYLSQVRHEAAIRATQQPADVSQARPAQEDAPVADGTNWREVASSLNAALLSNDASHAEQARRIYVRALIAATDTPASAVAELEAWYGDEARDVLDRFYWRVSPAADGKHRVEDTAVKAVIRLCERLIEASNAGKDAAPPPIVRSDADETAQPVEITDAIKHLSDFLTHLDPDDDEEGYNRIEDTISALRKISPASTIDAAPVAQEVSEAMVETAARAGLSRIADDEGHSEPHVNGYDIHCGKCHLLFRDHLRDGVATIATKPAGASGVADDARDAARYRWLKDDERVGESEGYWMLVGPPQDHRSLDDSIDAAIAASSDTPAPDPKCATCGGSGNVCEPDVDDEGREYGANDCASSRK